MKQILFFSLVLFSLVCFSQTQLGLKLSPVIVTNRVTNDAQDVENDGASLKLSIGLVMDKPLADSYFLSSGLIYVPKKAAFRTDSAYTEEYTLQYLQIPLTLKLFTNEVAPDFKVYFQIGGGLEIKVFDQPDSPDNFIINKFNPVDFSVILGTGVEYKAGINTTIFGGVSYNRGLVNTVNEAVPNAEDLQLRNTIVSIDFGVKF